MSERHAPRVAIVDYGMGNLYSVQRACAHVGLDSFLTSDPDQVLRANAVVLPGVGAMPEAMRILDSSGLGDAIRESAAAGTPLLGVCLGLQLLMTHGSEFKPHLGLGIIEGKVVRFEGNDADGSPLKVPHIGWSAISYPPRRGQWISPVLKGVADGALMYFVHSYYVRPANPGIVAATAHYGPVEFCAAVARDNIFACQFHPERSGPAGLAIYKNFADALNQSAINTLAFTPSE
jgi:imidazole glycerol-phosphate synthase subunit HisH